MPQDSSDHLMIVEDERAIQDMIVEWVRFNTDYRISVAADGQEALALFRDDPAEVILSDVRMPNLSGVQLIKKIRRIDPKVLFIMMSGCSELDDAVEALREGAIDFFQKPFRMGNLMMCLDRAFQQVRSRSLRRAVQSFLVEDHRVFSIPNDIENIGQVTAALTDTLSNDPSIDDTSLEGIRAALHEMIINAIEHGNLEISFEAKSELMVSPDGWCKEVERRAKDPDYRDRRVTVTADNTPSKVSFQIVDEGSGFDHSNLPDPDQLAEVPHGRGILITGIHMDEVRYNDAGNEVTLVKYKRSPEGKPPPSAPTSN